MAGSCILAMESRKHAARRPSPPLPSPGVGLLFEQAEPVDALLVDILSHQRIEEEAGHVVGQRAPDEELHGKVVDTLGVLTLVRLLGAQPPLRQDIPHRPGGRLVALARTERGGIDNVVEHEMALVERIAGPGKLIGPHPYCSSSFHSCGGVVRHGECHLGSAWS